MAEAVNSLGFYFWSSARFSFAAFSTLLFEQASKELLY